MGLTTQGTVDFTRVAVVFGASVEVLRSSDKQCVNMQNNEVDR